MLLFFFFAGFGKNQYCCDICVMNLRLEPAHSKLRQQTGEKAVGEQFTRVSSGERFNFEAFTDRRYISTPLNT